MPVHGRVDVQCSMGSIQALPAEVDMGQRAGWPQPHLMDCEDADGHRQLPIGNIHGSRLGCEPVLTPSRIDAILLVYGAVLVGVSRLQPSG